MLMVSLSIQTHLSLNGGSLVDLISVAPTITHSAISANIINAD